MKPIVRWGLIWLGFVVLIILHYMNKGGIPELLRQAVCSAEGCGPAELSLVRPWEYLRESYAQIKGPFAVALVFAGLASLGACRFVYLFILNKPIEETDDLKSNN